MMLLHSSDTSVTRPCGSGISAQSNMLKLDRRGRDTGQAHRTPRGAAALSRAPRIEDLEPRARLVHRHVAVAENHGIDVRITATKSIEAPTAGAGIMENRDSLVF